MLFQHTRTLFLLGAFLFLPLPVPASAATSTPATLPTHAQLSAPHIWEIPDGVWKAPWSGACEEASIAMVEAFYRGARRQNITKQTAKKLMQPFFAIEDKLFGSNLDTNSTRTAKLIDDYTMFDATIKTNPTLTEIKSELVAGRPVISLHYGRDLKNPRHRWRAGGSSYHMMVLTGFDDAKQVFYANDPELANGLDYPYSYATIMASWHDFNHTTKKASGPPTVLFTSAKNLVRAESGKRIYLIRNEIKYYIASPAVFNKHRLSWGAIKTISAAQLAQYSEGEAINK